MSIDVVFPFTLHSSGHVLIYAIGNLALAPIALNFLKFINLPIFLSKLSVYYHQYLALEPYIQVGQPAETAELKQIRKDLLADCLQLTAIRRKIPMNSKVRLHLQVSPEQFDYLKEEWVSGKICPGSLTRAPVKYFPTPRGIHATLVSEWEDYQPCIIQIVEEIEQWTGVYLPRSSDGCPYFAHPDTMPWNWNWSNYFRLIYDRKYRITILCNRYWPTEDTTITIFLECIFQVCVGTMVVKAEDSDVKHKMRAKYAEFLGLPLGIEPKNPLRFTVTHRVHGRQIHTGWPPLPTRLMDCIDKKNSILIETQSSNYFKYNFHESYYPRLKDLLLDV